MYSSGIIDPTKVTRTGVRKKSVVSTILTTECMVVNKKEEKTNASKILGMNNGGEYSSTYSTKN